VKRVLITGVAGFIGYQVAMQLLKDGAVEVIGIDILSDYYAVDLKESRLIQLKSFQSFHFEKLDICDYSGVDLLLAKYRVDTVIHLAAQAGIRLPFDQYSRYIDSNLTGFSNSLYLSAKNGISNFIYASSSSVYGNSTAKTYKEGDLAIRPISIYGATKLANEILTPAFISGSQTRARGMRFFTVYGPWGRPDMAYFRIIDSALNGSEFKKFGGGEIKRDFTFVDDITVTIEKLSYELTTRHEGYSDVVNIGGGNPHSLNDLINVIGSQLGSKPSILELESNPNDVSFTCADVSMLNDLVNSVPVIDLETGVEKTINWAKQVGIKENLNEWINSTY